MKRITLISFFSFLVAILIVFSAPSALARNKVLSLDGDGDYVEVFDNDSLDLTNTLTLEAWVLPYREFASIIAKGDTVESYGLWVWHDFCVAFRYNYPEGGVLASTTGKGNVWSHFAVSWNGQIVRFFLDGELIEEKEFSDTLILNNENLFIGANFPGGNEYLKGFIDEIRIWNVARTQEEIQDNMDKPLENPESDPNLVGYWNFDSGTADDLSQHENHGKLYGDAYIADVIYVSSEYGSPTGDGTKENPYDTIQRGINEAGWKDIVQVLPGTYTENINLRSDLIVLGSGIENTIITAESGNIMTANGVHNVSLSGFTIDGQGNADNGILCSGTTSEMEINNNVITSAVKGINCSDSASVTIERNIVQQNTGNGIYCGDSANPVIDDNDIEYNNGHGVECAGNSNALIINNHINHNQNNGIACRNTSNVNAEYNIIENNQNYDGITLADSSQGYFSHNTICRNNGMGFRIFHNSIAIISDNFIHSNAYSAIWCCCNSDVTIIRNTINKNLRAVEIEGYTYLLIGGSLVDANNIANHPIAIGNHTPNTINATFNYWGITDKDEIAAMMWNGGGGSVDFVPFINTLDEIVADTSGDGTVSAYDAALILQFVVGLIDTFPVSIPKSPDQIIPRNYTVSLPSLAAHAGKRIQAPVAINDANGLTTGGIILKYDPTVLKAVDVLPTTTLNGSYWKANTKLDGEIRFAFAFTSAFMDTSGTMKSLFMVEFEVLPNTTGKISPLILEKVHFSESQSINKINGSVVILPERTILLQNYPNPFNPETWIPYQLATDSPVMISIYNAKGIFIRVLHLGNQNAGIYMTKDKAAYWDGKNSVGEKVASGVYFYTLQIEYQRNSDQNKAEKFISTKKMVILK